MDRKKDIKLNTTQILSSTSSSSPFSSLASSSSPSKATTTTSTTRKKKAPLAGELSVIPAPGARLTHGNGATAFDNSPNKQLQQQVRVGQQQLNSNNEINLHLHFGSEAPTPGKGKLPEIYLTKQQKLQLTTTPPWKLSKTTPSQGASTSTSLNGDRNTGSSMPTTMRKDNTQEGYEDDTEGGRHHSDGHEVPR